MYTRATIVEHLKAKPFRPFKVRLRNGRIFNVRAADDLWVGLSGFLVFDSGRNDYGVSDVRSIAAVEAGRLRKNSR